MAYQLYSKLPGQNRFYCTSIKTLQQVKYKVDAGIVQDYFLAEEILKAAKDQCVNKAIEWCIKEDGYSKAKRSKSGVS